MNNLLSSTAHRALCPLQMGFIIGNGIGIGFSQPSGSGGAAAPVAGDLIEFQIMDASPIPNGGNIDGNGVIARMRFKGLSTGATFDRTMGHLTVNRPGWNTSRVYSASNVTDVITFEAIHRQPNPNETSLLETVVGSDVDVYVSLSDVVWVADTIVSVTLLTGFYGANTNGVFTSANATMTQSSTLPYPYAVMKFLELGPYARVPPAGLRVEAMVDHWEARNDQPVAAVDLYAKSGASESVTQCGAMALSTQVSGGYSVPCFGGTVTQGALPNGPGTIGIRAYPWVGNAIWDSANIGEAWPTFNLPTGHPCELDGDNSYSPAYAVVSPTGALIGSPSVSTTEPAAYIGGGAAYASVKTAGDAIAAFNNSGARARPHNDTAGGVALVPSGATVSGFSASMGSFAVGSGIYKMRMETGGDRATTVFTSGGTSKAPAKRFMIENMTITPGATGATHTVLDSGATAGAPTTALAESAYAYLVVKNCVGTGQGDNTNAPFFRCGWRWFFNNSFTSFGDDLFQAPAGNTVGIAAIHGGTCDNGAATVHSINCTNVAGFRGKGFAFLSQAAGAQPDFKGQLVWSTRLDTLGTGGFGAGMNTRGIGVEGISLMNLLIRQTRTAGTAGVIDAGESATISIAADYDVATGTDRPAVQNVLLSHVSAAGGRCNLLYNEVGGATGTPVRVEKRARLRFCSMNKFNSKGDNTPVAGGASGVRTGALPWRYGVSSRGLVTGSGSSDGTPPGYASWLGELLWRNSEHNIGLANAYVTDTSLSGTNVAADDGDFHPAAKLKDRVPTGLAVITHDLGGAVRLNDGTGAVGAYERTS